MVLLGLGLETSGLGLEALGLGLETPGLVNIPVHTRRAVKIKCMQHPHFDLIVKPISVRQAERNSLHSFLFFELRHKHINSTK